MEKDNKAQGKRPYNYFLGYHPIRMPVWLQRWERYHTPNFVFANDGSAYSLHATADDCSRFSEKLLEGRIWEENELEPNRTTVYVTKKTFNKIVKESKRNSGVFVIARES